ncbi:hypothetical protein F66182_8935 [Fusarium sp. NRRL 66182]|nr:hypothetical protein F66182_8935 [Fusarium sp. NRRL 66182]
MSTMELSHHPVFKEFSTFVLYPPSLNDPKFERCHGQAGSSTKTPRKCENPIKEANRKEAQRFWQDFSKMKELLDEVEFYKNIEEFLELIHCHHHYSDALLLLLSEECAPRLHTKSPASDSDSFIHETPSKRAYQSLSSDDAESSMAPIMDMPPSSDASHSAVKSAAGATFTASHESTRETLVNAAAEVTVKQTATATITTVRQENAPDVDKNHINQQGTYILGIGTSIPQRNREHENGIVYILQHEKHADVFKIGSTKGTADYRLAQPRNCYSKDTKIIYESDSPFAGAFKAESLAQAALRKHNMHIKKCDMCQNGHREWFRASRAKVLDAVTVMEKFVRLPAYELRDGKMRLSSIADGLVRQMCNFSPDTLETLIVGHHESVGVKVDSSEESMEAKSTTTTEQIAVSKATTEVVVEPVEQDESFISKTSSNKSKPALATNLRGAYRDVKLKCNDVKAVFRRRVSREPVPDDGADDSKTLPNLESLLAGLLWTILPEVVNPKEGLEGEGKPKTIAAVRAAVMEMASQAKQDFCEASRVTKDTKS